jgi:uncharacterized protein (TIRG00374 family)
MMVESLRSVGPAGAGLALAAEVASYLFLGLHLRALGGPADNIRRLAPFRLATVVFGLGSVMPAAPAEGIVMAASALKHRRLARRRTVLVLGVSQVFGTLGLYLLVAIDAIAVVLSAHDGPLGARSFLVAGGVGALVLIAVLALVMSRPRSAEIVGLIAGRLRHPRTPAPASERRRRGLAWHAAGMHVVTEQHKAPWLIVTMLLGWALDGICLFFALAAVGVRIDLDVLLLAYSASAAAALIPLLPAGLGIAETVTPAILHLYGVPFEAGLAGLLVYRAFATLLPAVVGAGSLASLRLLKAPVATPDEMSAIADTAGTETNAG